MLHEDQVTSAPIAVRVSMRTALKERKGRTTGKVSLDLLNEIQRARAERREKTHVWMVM